MKEINLENDSPVSPAVRAAWEGTCLCSRPRSVKRLGSGGLTGACITLGWGPSGIRNSGFSLPLSSAGVVAAAPRAVPREMLGVTSRGW